MNWKKRHIDLENSRRGRQPALELDMNRITKIVRYSWLVFSILIGTVVTAQQVAAQRDSTPADGLAAVNRDGPLNLGDASIADLQTTVLSVTELSCL